MYVTALYKPIGQTEVIRSNSFKLNHQNEKADLTKQTALASVIALPAHNLWCQVSPDKLYHDALWWREKAQPGYYFANA